jgi:hypothetical protein
MPTSTRLLVRVGDGRGFVVEERLGSRRLVVTAAHCLPEFPRTPLDREAWRETTRDILGPLGDNTLISADILFADPISDIAVLGSPNDPALSARVSAYHELICTIMPLKVGGAIPWDTPAPVRLIALDGRPIEGVVRHVGGWLYMDNLSAPIQPGMSGSPVLDEAGAAIALVSESSKTVGRIEVGHLPRLIACLPGQFLINLGLTKLVADESRLARAYYRHRLRFTAQVECQRGSALADGVHLGFHTIVLPAAWRR